MEAEPSSAAPKRKRRLFHLRPAHLLLGLFVIEGILFLSERFRWFIFNEHKGWTPLIALACVGLTIIALVVWFVAALVCRRSFQFRLWSLLLLALAIAIPCNWVRIRVKKARLQSETAAAIRKDGGQALYDYQLAVPPGTILNFLEPPGPAWLRKLIGDDFFTDVIDVRVSSDADVEQLAAFDHVRSLNVCRFVPVRENDPRWHLADCDVTDTGIQQLSCMTELRSLNIMSRHVTDRGLETLIGLKSLKTLEVTSGDARKAGVDNLRRALPNCRIGLLVPID